MKQSKPGDADKIATPISGGTGAAKGVSGKAMKAVGRNLARANLQKGKK